MGLFSYLCEELRSEVDEQGARGCYAKSVRAYSRKTGIPIDALWVVVDGILQGSNPVKMLKKIKKSWGGTDEQWVKWMEIAQQRPDCKKLEP